MKSIRIIILFFISLIISCYSVNYKNLSNYNNESYNNFNLYYQIKPPNKMIEDFNAIYLNLSVYLNEILELNTNTDKVNIALLPQENNVVNFQKKGSSAICNYNKMIIFLLDYNNLDASIYSLYGNPPDDIYITSFTHELTHLFTLPQIKFSKSMHMYERFAQFCSYIDFRDDNFEIYKTNFDLKQAIDMYFISKNNQKIEDFKLVNIDFKETRELSIFLVYLHDKKEYRLIKRLIESKNIEEFIINNNWTEIDNIDFINWIKNYGA